MIKPGKWMNIFPLLLVGCSAFMMTIPIMIFVTVPAMMVVVALCGLCFYFSYYFGKRAKEMFEEIPNIIKNFEEYDD